MFYITILVCALVGAMTHGPVGVLAGAVIGFLIAKIDGVIVAIGKTDEPISYDLFVKRAVIMICICIGYGIYKAATQ
ncbi:hypothetical protein EKN38_13085 [Enterobacter sp. WCHEn045836]|uniref:hypothetical protein n=1 Tax=Enterobacter sp. WCHEn045836 TaxID=2497434 RepID=UPI000F8232A6|nr:hypothetical protein [Enterobacter sp. WCHEn045836]RTQ01302.1 hypothetical protein EKN38_13085 [Enterobacter sp. WCHEn045836]